MKKTVAILIAAAMLLSLMLAGCGTSDSSSAGASETKSGEEAVTPEVVGTMPAVTGDSAFIESMTVSVPRSPKTLFPIAGSSGDFFFFEMYEMLFYLDENREIKAWLADADKGEFGGYDHEEGSSDYTVYLCDYIYDWAGNNIVASDVVFSYEYMKTLTNGQWDYLDYIEVVDDYTVIFHCTQELKVLGALEKLFAGKQGYIFSQTAYEASPTGLSTDSCGTGHYKLVSYTPDSELVITVNDNYWQTEEKTIPLEKANVGTITLKVMTEDNVKVIALETGEIDAVDAVALNLLDEFKDGGAYDDKYDLYAEEYNTSSGWSFNFSEESVMSNPDLRRAILYAFDSEAFVAMRGAGTCSALPCFGGSIYTDYNTAWESWDNYMTDSGNMEKVEYYKEQAGYNNEPITLLYMTNNDTDAMIIGQILTAAGFNIQYKGGDNAFVTTAQADPTAWDIGWGFFFSDDYTLASAFRTFFSTTGRKNGDTQSFLKDDTLQELISVACNTETHTQENVDALVQYIIDNAYAGTVCMEYRSRIVPSYCTGLVTYQGMTVYGACSYAEP